MVIFALVQQLGTFIPALGLEYALRIVVYLFGWCDGYQYLADEGLLHGAKKSMNRLWLMGQHIGRFSGVCCSHWYAQWLSLSVC